MDKITIAAVRAGEGGQFCYATINTLKTLMNFIYNHCAQVRSVSNTYYEDA